MSDTELRNAPEDKGGGPQPTDFGRAAMFYAIDLLVALGFTVLPAA